MIVWCVIVGHGLTCWIICVVSGSEHEDPVCVSLLD